MVLLKDIVNDSEIEVYVPSALLDLELGEVKLKNTVNEKNHYVFEGKINGLKKTSAEYIIDLNIKDFDMSIVESLEPYVNGKKFDEEIKDVASENLVDLLYDKVALTVTVNNKDFSHVERYNIYGGLIAHS